MDVDLEKEESLEYQLEHLEEYDNRTQLRLLLTEIEFVTEHGLQPPCDWFERRVDIVIAYSGLHWRELAEEYEEDPYLTEWSQRIMKSCMDIMDDWSVGPMFDLSTYYSLLHDVDDLRRYYFEKYVPDEDEDGLFGLISGIQGL
jgi:hypothetical protein